MTLFEGRGLLCVRGERRVFANLDFAVSAGGLLVLTGPNGSGKSSLLRVMAGLLRPAQGAPTRAGAPGARGPGPGGGMDGEEPDHRAVLGHEDAQSGKRSFRRVGDGLGLGDPEQISRL